MLAPYVFRFEILTPFVWESFFGFVVVSDG